MVIDLIFAGAALLCAILLVTGKPLNISITHRHVVENQELPVEPDAQEAEPTIDGKNLPEFLQEFLGVTDER
jgi:hypothetical protein